MVEGNDTRKLLSWGNQEAEREGWAEDKNTFQAAPLRSSPADPASQQHLQPLNLSMEESTDENSTSDSFIFHTRTFWEMF